MEANRARNLSESRRIRRRFVDACDAKLPRVGAGAIGRQTDHIADRQAFGLGELTGDEDVGGLGVLGRRQDRYEPDSEDG
jgi:hypothetical protein